MTHLKRRHFLQFTGATLASLGISQVDFLLHANRTAHLLAQPTKRKLALLVGINQYLSDVSNLWGCLTDVEMQYELLRHRYGFQATDILMLTDQTTQKPSRENILTAFEEHLIKQAQPGDVVVFHFSGHGGLITDPQPLPSQTPTGSLIPNDFTLAQPNNIMGRTLFLLSSQLRTNRFTMVLDSCYSGGGLRGNQVVRALPIRSNSSAIEPSPAELKYQEKQLEKLGWSLEDFQKRRRQGIAKGVGIGSAQKDQLALDASFDGFYAGALTYLLTRYFWQLPSQEPLSSTFDRLALITQELAATSGNSQIPRKEVAPGQPWDQQPLYQLSPDRPNAEALVRKINPDGQIVFWMGGISSQSLEAFQPGSLFSMINDKGEVLGELEQTNRAGLEGYALLKSGQPPQVGTLLREKLRNLPMDLSLNVGLDQNLLTKRVDIERELQAIPKPGQIQVVPVNQRGVVDVIIGSMTDLARQEGQNRKITISQPNGSVGLFTANNTPIANSFGQLEESPKQIVARLRPKLKMLLAKKFLNLTLNGAASQLKVDISLKSRQSGHVQVLSRSGSKDLGLQTAPRPHQANSLVDIEVANQEETPIYLAALAIGDDASITILHPANWDSPEAASLVKPKTTTPVSMEVYGPAGFFEILVITSVSPLRDTLRAIQTISRGRGLAQGTLLNFDGKTRSANDSEDSVVQVSRNLIHDITRAIAVSRERRQNRQGLDPQRAGVFSSILQVID
ncbi:MAG: caspase family protein [Coleofasciculaceae cyanobacterium]